MASLLPSLAVTTAVSAQVSAVKQLLEGRPLNLAIQANFIYGSGGASVDAYVQTSFDQATWCDIAEFHFTTASARKLFNLSAATPITSQATPTDGSLASNTAVDGLLGQYFRVKYTTVGTYAGGTTLEVDINATQLRI